MELKLGIGIGEAKFGMLEKDITNLFGSPDSIKFEDEEDKRIYSYNNSKFRFAFYQKENGKLGYIESSNQSLHFNGKIIINTKSDIVRNEIFGNLITDWEFDDYGSFEVYFNHEHWLSLHEEYGNISEVKIGVPFKNEFDYLWPD